ncbi:unnamed protein product [Schistosoma mattheei]|uniref:Uncharacterized protein n=1 Tax=Schistosoma mattheei TaxID=31246 RepID=A0A183NM94_9TREM|nr:unnamed protein product [Schistosoma mattheei]
MKPSSTSEPFCIYVDQLRFMPDNSTIFKLSVTMLLQVHRNDKIMLNPLDFVLLGTCQRRAPVILRELMLPDGFDPVS